MWKRSDVRQEGGSGRSEGGRSEGVMSGLASGRRKDGAFLELGF